MTAATPSAKAGPHAAIPDFSRVPLQGGGPAALDDWRTAAGQPGESLAWQTPESIPVRPLYTAADLTGVDHLDTMPGMPPFLRGPYPTMYVLRPWTVRQYAGFSTA
jgi:methylmalonyl-CoA mutase